MLPFPFSPPPPPPPPPPNSSHLRLLALSSTLLTGEVEREGRPRHKRVHRLEQARAPVADDEDGLFALTGVEESW